MSEGFEKGFEIVFDEAGIDFVLFETERLFVREYNIDDFRSELHRKVDTLDKSLELTCILTHKDMLDNEEGKETLRETLLDMTAVLKKYFEMC